MSGDISLYDLVNLSVGSPEAGAVNFKALHTLLHALLGHLAIQDVTTTWKEDSSQPEPDGQPQIKSRGERCGPYQHDMEERLRQIEKQIAMIENLPSGTELLEHTSSSATPVSDIWQLMQIRRKIQANEDGVSKSMELVQDLLKEIKDLKEFRDSLRDNVKNLQQQLEQMNDAGGLAERVVAVEDCCHRVDELEAATRTLKERVLQYPEPEDLDQCVTWDVMHSALLSEREQLHQELAASGSIDPTSHFKAPAKPLVPGSQSTPGKPLTSPRPAAPHKPSTHPTPSAPHRPHQDQREEEETPPTQGKTALSVAHQGEETSPAQGEGPPETGTLPGRPPVSGPSLPQQKSSDTGLEAVDAPQSRVASVTERYPETVEALRDLGGLRKRHGHLEALVTTLEASKVDQAQLAHLRELITDMGAKDLPNNLMDKLNHMRALVDSLMTDREKLDSLEEVFMNLESAEPESTSEEAPETVDSENIGSLQLKVQISYLRMVVQTLEEDMKELKVRGELSGQETMDHHLQDQPDRPLRGMPEEDTTIAPLSSLPSRSLLEESGQEDQSDSQGLGQARGQGQGQEDAVDIGRRISLLFLRYEQLQDTVKGILRRQTAGGQAEENKEQMCDVQKAILQLQTECERLHDKTNHLTEEQSGLRDIQQLYKTVEELEEKKADKQLLEKEMQIKADKCSLDGMVGRVQFDTMTEHLNTMFDELLTKVTGQEQDWHTVTDKLSTDIESKLDRIELESVKTQLEDSWKSVRKRLQAQPSPEHENAAGIRKQLVARFHCISCDRPLSMQASGPHLVTMPSAPGLPSHKSRRPHTVYELEHFRHHDRRPGTNLEMVNSERSMLPLLRKHAVCRQIAQVHTQGSMKETQTHRLPILSPLPKISHERTPEMADYSYPAMSRSCGGSHTTVNYPNRRYSRLQRITHLLRAEAEGEEVDILGSDGHIYKGRLNTQAIRTVDAGLPIISPKEGMCKSKDKVASCQSQRSGAHPEPGHATPVRPQSAKTQRSRSTSSSSTRERPVSVLGCMSQGSLPPRSPQADTNGEQQAVMELHVDLGQEEEPLTTL